MNHSFHCLIKPFDTWFFRDHRPFEMGEFHLAETLYPTPLTFMGALSNAYFDVSKANKNQFLKEKVNDDYLGTYSANLSDLNGVRILGVFEASPNMIYYLIPANFLSKELNSGNFEIQKIEPFGPQQMQYPLIDFEYQRGFIDSRNFLRILEGEEEGIIMMDRQIFQGTFTDEIRQGIAISGKGTVIEGMLYTTPHFRTHEKIDKTGGAGFFVLYQTANKKALPITQYLILGGEKRLSYLAENEMSKLKNQLDNFIDQLKTLIEGSWKDKNSFGFCLYLVTPAIFKDGWKPQNWPWQNRSEFFTACVPKPVWVSGFRITSGKRGEPRPLLRAAAAGSVYFFKSNDKSLQKELLNNYFLNKSVSEYYPQAGFGMTFILPWLMKNK